MPPKALASDFTGRFREIVSDPLNLLISRVIDAGTVADDLVVLHNGHRVPLRGPGSYYNNISIWYLYFWLFSLRQSVWTTMTHVSRPPANGLLCRI